LSGPDGLTRDALRRLPKAELHTHLDGCLRPATLLELAREFGVPLPASTPAGVAEAMLVRTARNLEEYLQRYVVTVQVMQSREALVRVARELAEDAAADGIRYLEARFCPALHAPGVTVEGALEAVLEGLAAGGTSAGIRTRVIACGLRTLPPETSLRIARAAVTYREAGVVAFDLAGAEAGHPPEAHAPAFRTAADGGLRLTCHAGEAAGADYVRAAVETCGAERIGHGVRLRDDPGLLERFVDRGVPLEVCLTSNLHTRAVADLRDHPAAAYLEAGVPVTLNTDSRLMDRTTLTDEYWLAHTVLGLDGAELARVARAGFEHAFLPDDARRALLAEVSPAIEALA
jgi:adenosine deaminase